MGMTPRAAASSRLCSSKGPRRRMGLRMPASRREMASWNSTTAKPKSSGCGRGHGTRSRRLRVGSWRGIFLDGHAEFVEGAGVLCVLRRDALLDRLGAFELRARIEEAALFATVQFGLALGTRPVGIEPRSKHGAAIRTASARDRADHARRPGAELIGTPRPAPCSLPIWCLALLIFVFP